MPTVSDAGWVRTAGQLDLPAESLVEFVSDSLGLYSSGDETGDGVTDWWVSAYRPEGPLFDFVLYFVPGPVSGRVEAADVAAAEIHESEDLFDTFFLRQPDPGDLTGDGIKDVLLGGSDENLYVLPSLPTTGVHLFSDLAPTEVTGLGGWPLPPVSDLTGDGVSDLVIHGAGTLDLAQYAGNVHRVPGPFQGAVVIAQDQADLSFYGEEASLALGDVLVAHEDTDGDGMDEWWLSANTGGALVHGALVFDVPQTGSFVSGDAETIVQAADGQTLWVSKFADFDGDGMVDYAVMDFQDTDSAVAIATAPFPVGDFDPFLNAVTTIDGEGVLLFPDLATDLDGDGVMDLIVRTQHFPEVATWIWGPITALGATTVSAAAGVQVQVNELDRVISIDDVTGDCRPEFLVHTSLFLEALGSQFVLPSESIFGP